MVVWLCGCVVVWLGGCVVGYVVVIGLLDEARWCAWLCRCVSSSPAPRRWTAIRGLILLTVSPLCLLAIAQDSLLLASQAVLLGLLILSLFCIFCILGLRLGSF